MKKLLEKDKKIRLDIKNNETTYFILLSIFKNLNFISLVRWNAFLKLKQFESNKMLLSSRCLISINKKRFNKLTTFSRNIFLKLIRSGNIYGFNRSNW